ncbi:ABC transporter ATP-binding protein [Neobacillus sp. 114]|uniref:ABC transporter ATP-binding protein n=1 Tax=Neobacillus sp. 114 TaxID=3048535 RepID=UPI0024C3FEA4|nr:ABC transporter ATP-binding protein [Neobacillus sp. 114]
MPLLKAEKVTRIFGGIAAVNDVSFHVNSGDILGLIGPNGAGKSTTFNLISGFYNLSSGKIYFNGENVTNKNPEYLNKRQMVRTFQHNVLFDEMTVYENVYMGTVLKKMSEIEKGTLIEEILTFLNLIHVKDELTKNLPHGTQRMLGIAVALATKPKLLLLDEPLTGMNIVEIKEAVEVLKKLNTEKNITIVIVEHNMKAVMELCDRIVVLSYGEKIAEGTPEEVRQNAEVVRAYLGGS